MNTEKEINIPVDLDGSNNELSNLLNDDDIEYIRVGRLTTAQLHHSLGRWIRNNWGLWAKDSEIFQFFSDLGLHHPDDMSSIILDSFAAKLKGEEFDLDGAVKYYQEYWKKMDAKGGKEHPYPTSQKFIFKRERKKLTNESISKAEWVGEVYKLLCKSQGDPENQKQVVNLQEWAFSIADNDGEDGYYAQGYTPKEAHDEVISYG
jgi:hypothetical protein